MNHIETIARGVCVVGGKVLLCRPKGGAYSYLPGGHIEFGETSSVALVREVLEETGLKSSSGELMGVMENSFMQKGEQHCEISIVRHLALDGVQSTDEPPRVVAQEDWIEFVWWPIEDIKNAKLLPEDAIGYVKGKMV